jgi:flagellar motor switch protein FliN/FliY
MSAALQARFGGLVEELAAIIGAYGDAPADVTPGQFPHGRRLVATFAVSGGYVGSCTVAVDYAGAEAIARLLSGSEGALTDTAVADGLRAALGQSVAALASRGPSERLDMTLGSVESGGIGLPDGETWSYSVAVPGFSEPVLIGMTWAGSAGTVSAAGAEDEDGEAPRREERIEDRIDVILDIDLPIVVRFGRTEMPIRQLTRLGMGSVIDLGRSPDDPVELLVSDRVVAHGEVVIVGGNYGIRILDVASPSERVRSIEG